VFIGLASLIQLCLGIYLSFIQSDITTINRLIKTDKFDSYLAYILLVFIGLGFISFILTFFSIYGMIKRNRSLSLFVAVLWVRFFFLILNNLLIFSLQVLSVALNLVMFTVLFLYYYFILPQLRPLLVHSLQRSPMTTSNLLDSIQSRYTCCGINNKDDYNNLSLDPFPLSCCRTPNCWHDTEINKTNSSNETMPLIYPNGCYPIIEQYVTIELWTFVGVTGACALFQLLAITLMCILNQRYKNLDENNSKFAINQLATGVPINGSLDNNLQGSSKTIEETVEITQI
jgi:hypothetical protein